MKKIIAQAGELVGVAGIALCLASGIGRLSGQYLWVSYEMGSFFLLGIGLMVMGCLAQLYVIRRELRSGDPDGRR